MTVDFSTKERRFWTANDFYQQRFGKKVFRVSLNGGFTCPNKDGTAGFGGCVYCSPSGSGDFSGDPRTPLKTQFEEQVAMMRVKWPTGAPLVYFQANTNTYAPTDALRRLYEEALALRADIVGIVVATRPDCIPESTLDLLEELAKRTFVGVELGLQSIHPQTALWLNRGHDLACFDDAVYRLEKRGIHVVAHIINSLRGETREHMLDTIRHLNRLPLHGVKIHMLHVMKHTRLAKEFAEDPFELLSQDAYCELVADQIELMRPDLIVYRVTGDAPSEQLIAPEWTRKKFVVQNEIDKRLRRRGSFQGSRYEP
jgi:radical SAM protein (TIGR01212 family)